MKYVVFKVWNSLPDYVVIIMMLILMMTIMLNIYIALFKEHSAKQGENVHKATIEMHREQDILTRSNRLFMKCLEISSLGMLECTGNKTS